MAKLIAFLSDHRVLRGGAVLAVLFVSAGLYETFTRTPSLLPSVGSWSRAGVEGEVVPANADAALLAERGQGGWTDRLILKCQGKDRYECMLAAAEAADEDRPTAVLSREYAAAPGEDAPIVPADDALPEQYAELTVDLPGPVAGILPTIGMRGPVEGRVGFPGFPNLNVPGGAVGGIGTDGTDTGGTPTSGGDTGGDHDTGGGTDDSTGGTPTGGDTSGGDHDGGTTNPGTPGDPSDPSDPSDPGAPGDPADPGTPTTPGTPGTPGDPGSPGDPDTPTVPGTPGDPDMPTDPGDPADPDVPDIPVTPIPVPAPGGLAALFLGTAVLVWRRRR